MSIRAEDLILISVDDHIIEPPDLFDAHLPERFKAEAPRIVRRADGADVWRFGEVEVPNVALNAVAGRPKEEYGVEPQSLEEIRPGCFLVDERVKDMNAGGVLSSMNFPSFPGFAARLFAVEDEEFRPGPGAGLQRLAHRRVVRGPPGAVHPDGAAGDLGRREVRRRGAPGGREGLPLALVHREPGGARDIRASTTPSGTRCGPRCATPRRCCRSIWVLRASSASRRRTRPRT